MSDPDDPREDQQERDVRVDDDLKQFVLERHVALVHGEAVGVQSRRLRPLYLEAVELLEEIIDVRGDDVDQALPRALRQR